MAHSLTGETLLHVCASANQLDLVRWLVENGALPNSVDFNGNTPLHFACAAGNVLVVKLLLEQGATNEINFSGVFPLGLVPQDKFEEILALFTSKQHDDFNFSLFENIGRP